MFSVVIPTYNRTDQLVDALESIYRQTLSSSEIIVVDDGSQPRVAESQIRDPGNKVALRILRNEKSRGANTARNIGFNAARSEWIAFLDDDDHFMPNKLEVVSNVIMSDRDVDVVYHPAVVIIEQESNVKYITSPKVIADGPAGYRQLLCRNHIGGTSMVVVKRAKLLEVGGFDESMPALQDHELWIRLAQSGARFKLVDAPLTLYFQGVGDGRISMSFDRRAKAFMLLETKHVEGYSSLTAAEQREFKAYKIDGLVRQAIISKRRWDAFKLNLHALIKLRKLRYAAGALVSLLSVKTAFRLRSVLHK